MHITSSAGSWEKAIHWSLSAGKKELDQNTAFKSSTSSTTFSCFLASTSTTGTGVPQGVRGTCSGGFVLWVCEEGAGRLHRCEIGG
eukprot:37403-Amorphochlora_amoeboformis.AAC.2